MTARDTGSGGRVGSALRAWLSESEPFSWRLHLVVLVLIVFLGLVRGFFWVGTTELWNPIDEAQHYAYVASLASGDGIPEVGADRVPLEVLSVGKVSTTLDFRNYPVQISPDDSFWGNFREQYEGGGVQGPVYYAIMAIPYWLAHPFGVLPAIYAIRAASVIVSLLAVPLLWMLSRELFPRRPAVWLAAPAILVMVQGFNANLASITNDALLIPAAIAVLLPVARAWRGLTYQQAVVAGALFGLAMLIKPTNVALAPLIGLAVAASAVLQRESVAKAACWLALFGGVAFLVYLPYLAWNVVTYHALSAADEANAITGPVQGKVPFSLSGMRTHLKNGLMGFWQLQPYGPLPDNKHSLIFEGAAAIATLAGVAAALFRRTYEEASALIWLAVAFPLAFAMKVMMNYGIFESTGTVVGRHLYPALGPICIVIAAGLIVAFGNRWGVVAVIAVASMGVVAEQAVTRNYVDAAFTFGLIGADVAPAVEQSWNDEFVWPEEIEVQPPCPVQAVAIGVSGPPPQTLTIAQSSANTPVGLFATQGLFALYGLPTPLSSDFRVLVPPDTPVGSSRQVREPSVSFGDVTGNPMVRLYCQTDDAKAERFEQRYGPQHPGIVTYHRLRDWTSAWEWLGWAVLATAVTGIAVSEVRRRAARASDQEEGRSGLQM